MKNRFTQASAGSLQLHAISAFNDNYIWLIHNGRHAVVVDPGDSVPVIQVLQQLGLQLDTILITHHHHDHVGGIAELKKHYPQTTVFGPAHENIPHRDVALTEGTVVDLAILDLRLQVIDIPGHTAGHIAYFGYSDHQEPILFCGDTLFSAGCGRLFEGTPAQMLQSLAKINALPSNTLVCCAHEYTLSNIIWALTVEPDNTQLQAYYDQVYVLREKNEATLPSTLALEQQVNPFLRTHIPAVQSSAAQYSARTAHNETEVLAQLREWKNNA